ncbi:TonB-dependent receptor plug domain-containing protein [Agaribacter flavus]|uniref:TonB-dependent receptor plug domain-containing protein n=1 Tax=Agaribacter flavus TaxID=1902781 RepID=A0ABV7FRP4_9ALTE
MQCHKISLAISVALSSPFVLAESSNFEESVENIVVVSSRIAMPLREVATSISVVTEEDLAQRGYVSFVEALRTQVAINTSSSGGIGSVSSLRVRGEEGYRTLVRIDGVDISDPTGVQVQPQLAHLVSSNITRVEILRGSQGLVYGADAGGVINVSTGRQQEGMFGSVTAEAGRYKSRNLSAEIGGTSGSLEYYISAADYSTEGFNARVSDTELADNDGYDNTTIHTRLAYKVSDNLHLGLVARTNDGEGEFDACGFGDSFTHLCSSDFHQDNVRFHAEYEHGDTNHQVALVKTLVERENFNQGIASFLTKGFAERLEYIGNAEIGDNSQLVWGFDWEKEVISTANQGRIQKGYYVEYQSEVLSDTFLTAGARYDDNEDFGEHLSYRLSAAKLWSLAEGELKLRTSYGTGFRAPSVFEVEYNRGPFAFAPASETQLKEEQSKGYEFGVGYTNDQGSSYEIVYFDQKIEDSIFFDLSGFSGYLQDIGTSFSEGLEVIINQSLADELVLTANYTYNDTEDTSGEQRLRRPKHLANIGLSYSLNRLQFTANMRFVRDFTDIGGELPNYDLVDISARYQVDDNLLLFARIENAFDTEYQDLAAFNTSGAALNAGLKYHF